MERSFFWYISCQESVLQSQPFKYVNKLIFFNSFQLLQFNQNFVVGGTVGTDLNSYLRPRLTALKRNRLFCYKKLKNKKVNTVDLIFVQFMLTLLLVSIAAFVLIFFEKWTYFESFYYLFITLTTVGKYWSQTLSSAIDPFFEYIFQKNFVTGHQK